MKARNDSSAGRSVPPALPLSRTLTKIGDNDSPLDPGRRKVVRQLAIAAAAGLCGADLTEANARPQLLRQVAPPSTIAKGDAELADDYRTRVMTVFTRLPRLGSRADVPKEVRSQDDLSDIAYYWKFYNGRGDALLRHKRGYDLATHSELLGHSLANWRFQAKSPERWIQLRRELQAAGINNLPAVKTQANVSAFVNLAGSGFADLREADELVKAGIREGHTLVLETLGPQNDSFVTDPPLAKAKTLVTAFKTISEKQAKERTWPTPMMLYATGRTFDYQRFPRKDGDFGQEIVRRLEGDNSPNVRGWDKFPSERGQGEAVRSAIIAGYDRLLALVADSPTVTTDRFMSDIGFTDFRTIWENQDATPENMLQRTFGMEVTDEYRSLNGRADDRAIEKRSELERAAVAMTLVHRFAMYTLL